MNDTENRISWLLVTPERVITGGEELYEQWLSTKNGFLWLDIEGPSSGKSAELLSAKFKLNPADIKEALRDRHPPRFTGDGEQLFVLLKPLNSDAHSLDFSTQQMAIFVGSNYVITRHNRESNYILMLRQKLLQDKLKLASPYQLAALLSQRMITRYGRILLDLEERLDVVEDELLEKPNERLVQELLGYKTALRKMRRILNYHMTVLRGLSRHIQKQKLVDVEDQFEDIAIEAERFNSLADLYQNMINDLIDGYISLNAHQLNQVMRVLTVVTVMFLPLGLLVGIYGMNFEHMPELKSRNGYFVLLGFMGLTVTSLIILFRKKRWL